MRFRSPLAALAAPAALPLLFALAVAGCGGVTNPQIVARDQATTASCDWYQSCNQIGPGLTYETRQSCETQVRAHWDQTWPPASCDSKINQSQLSICLSAIHATQCGNILDIWSTLGVKCTEANICSGP
jgi:hypothetical protein